MKPKRLANRDCLVFCGFFAGIVSKAEPLLSKKMLYPSKVMLCNRAEQGLVTKDVRGSW